MITFYTAVGRYMLRRDEQGHQYPVVITHGNESILGIQEMIIWSCLLWKVSTYEELKAEYLTNAKTAHISGEDAFDSYLNRLLIRELIVSGKDYVGIDAIYNLLSRLYVIPLADSLLVKTAAFLHLMLQGTPLRIAKTIFRRPKLSQHESQVLAMARQQMMSTAELIQCIQLGVTDVDTDDKLLAALYSDETTSSDNIHIISRFSQAQQPVLQAVANLYLKRQVMFEKAY